jgi:hypothetical protein
MVLPIPDVSDTFDSEWIRRSLHACELLERMHSLGSSDRFLIGFAISWAPFGGASANEVWLNFGVSRERFLYLLQAALSPKGTDLGRLRAMKRQLRNSLEQAWGSPPNAEDAQFNPPAASEKYSS